MIPGAPHDDVELSVRHVQALSSADQLAAFFAYLRYPADERLPMTAEALQLNRALADATRHMERLTSVEGGLDVYLFELTSVTVAYTRALARALRNRGGNFVLVLTDDSQRIDFVLLERQIPGLEGTGDGGGRLMVHPRVLSVDRRDPGRVALRVLRRFTLTEYEEDGYPDPYGQYDKLRSAYTIAEWAEPLYNNRALFSDYYLNERLPTLPEWNVEGRNHAFRGIRGRVARARQRYGGARAETLRDELIGPLLEGLGFGVEPGLGGSEADFLLHVTGSSEPAAFVLAYPWNRHLDLKDARDVERPEENPGAQVVSLLETGQAPWGIVTNGKVWRLYSARAHSRATNYYEVDLEETLALADPGEALRYYYLLFRADAFLPVERAVQGEERTLSFLDWLIEESTAYARELGERLKERVFEQIFPHFAEGFVEGLGGDEEAFAAFVGMLVGQSTVTPTLVAVYRAHHSEYKALVERIASTDWLIDQIVYRLYGLTEDEIAVVDGDAVAAEIR
jgi:hypothetical protein